jgi:hypothetical protein
VGVEVGADPGGGGLGVAGLEGVEDDGVGLEVILGR